MALIFLYSSIVLGHATLGKTALLSLLNLTNNMALKLFFSNLILVLVSFLLALYYMPNEKDFV
jgi:hypothetical protein